MTSLLRINEVARRIGVHRATVYRLVAAEQLKPPVRLTGQHGQPGGRVAWPEEEIDAYARGLIAARDRHFAKRGRKAAAKPAAKRKRTKATEVAAV